MFRHFFHGLDQRIEVDGAGCNQSQVVRCITCLMVGSHGFRIESRNGFASPQHSASKWMFPKVDFHRPLHRTIGWLVVVHSDLFQDHLSFRLKILVAQCRTHHVG